MMGRLALIIALCGLAGACSESPRTEGTPVAGANSTTSERAIPPGLEPPTQHNTNGRPDVTFDPCLDFDDEAIRGAGLDPTSRKRTDVVAGYTFLSCNFAGSTFLAGVAVGNVTYEENVDRFKDHSEPLNVNGVESLIAHGEIDPSSCTVVVRMRDGVMIVTVDPRLEAKRDGKDGCTFAPDVARALEPSLPKAR